jgi:hypothetical protein
LSPRRPAHRPITLDHGLGGEPGFAAEASDNWNHSWGLPPSMASPLITFPAHALLILEQRLREQEAEGVEMPEGMERYELALRILITAELLGTQDL